MHKNALVVIATIGWLCLSGPRAVHADRWRCGDGVCQEDSCAEIRAEGHTALPGDGCEEDACSCPDDCSSITDFVVGDGICDTCHGENSGYSLDCSSGSDGICAPGECINSTGDCGPCSTCTPGGHAGCPSGYICAMDGATCEPIHGGIGCAGNGQGCADSSDCCLADSSVCFYTGMCVPRF